MARLDIKSFEDGIEKIDSQIKKLEERKKKLQEKIFNTFVCPQCKWNWDAIYLNKVVRRIESIPKYTKISTIAISKCPLCEKDFETILQEGKVACWVTPKEETLEEGKAGKLCKVKYLKDKYAK